MTVWYPEYKLASGYNNAGSLVTVESIKPSGDIYAFTYPKSLGSGLIGLREMREDGLDYFRGFLYDEWNYTVMTRLQRLYLMNTFLAGNYSGKVTVRTRIDAETYANYNAVMHIPQPGEMGVNAQRQKKWRGGVTISFTRMVAL